MYSGGTIIDTTQYVVLNSQISLSDRIHDIYLNESEAKAICIISSSIKKINIDLYSTVLVCTRSLYNNNLIMLSKRRRCFEKQLINIWPSLVLINWEPKRGSWLSRINLWDTWMAFAQRKQPRNAFIFKINFIHFIRVYFKIGLKILIRQN